MCDPLWPRCTCQSDPLWETDADQHNNGPTKVYYQYNWFNLSSPVIMMHVYHTNKLKYVFIYSEPCITEQPHYLWYKRYTISKVAYHMQANLVSCCPKRMSEEWYITYTNTLYPGSVWKLYDSGQKVKMGGSHVYWEWGRVGISLTMDRKHRTTSWWCKGFRWLGEISN